MPCSTVHLLAAGRTLEGWRRQPSKAPFDPENRALVHDFISGAMAPDMGFVPQVDRTVSELVHYVETGNVVRALLSHARTRGEVAFSWGWATHHLADVLIHPLVGKAVGEVLYGDREHRVNASANEEAHVSVEVGLDIVVQASLPRIPEPAAGDGLQDGGLAFLARALTETYQLTFETDLVAGDFRVAARQLRFWPGLIRRLGRARRLNHPGGVAGLGAAALGSLSRLGPPRSAIRGFLIPQRPPAWLPEAVSSITADFSTHFEPYVTSGGAAFENRNLETGLLEDETRDHPYSEARRAWWVERRAQAGPRVAP